MPRTHELFELAQQAASDAQNLGGVVSTVLAEIPGATIPGSTWTAADAATELAEALRAVSTVTEATIARAGKIAKDDQSQPEGLDAEWAELRSSHESAAATALQRAQAAVQALEQVLYEQAKPRPGSDAAAQLVARGDVEAALASAEPGREIEVLSRLAAEGGEVAAAAVSPWARAKLTEKSPALGEQHRVVIAAAIKARAEHGSERERRIAGAFLETGRVGEAVRQAELAGHTLNQYLRSDRATRAERFTRDHRADRHADLRAIAEATRGG